MNWVIFDIFIAQMMEWKMSSHGFIFFGILDLELDQSLGLGACLFWKICDQFRV